MKLPRVTGDKVVKALKRAEFEEIRIRGSHHYLYHEQKDRRSSFISLHVNKQDMSMAARINKRGTIVPKNDLIFVVAFVIVSVVIITVPPLNATPLRAVVGFPLVLFLPGYSLVSALFPRKDELDIIERIALSIGLSICVVVFIGLGLNYTPWGIRLGPILLALSAFTLVFTGVSAVRRLGG